MNINPALKSNRSCLALTGVSVAELESLVPVFTQCLLEARINRNPDRQRRYGGGRTGGLKTIEEKLFYSLMYLKTYPTFDVASFWVGIDRSNCCRAIHSLLPVLEKTLGRKLVLPERQIRSVEEFMRLFPEVKDIFPDGTDRRVQKPVSQKRRKKLYSGKRKTTTRKNVVIADENKRVLILTPTKSGRRHDKRLFDKALGGNNIPSHVAAWVDTGFTGLTRDHPNTQIPKKRTKKHPLTEAERENNRLISGIRVIGEHTIAGIKRLRVTTDVYRNKLPNLDDTFMLLSAGLWNYHLAMSSAK